MKLRFVPASLAISLFGIACATLHSETLYSISAPALVNGETLTLSASSKYAGAISSLKFGNVEIVNTNDHGREIQSAIQFNDIGECYNPTEAGALADRNFDSTKSILAGLNFYGNYLGTTANMAYWVIQGEAGNGCNGAAPVSNTNTPPSGFLVQKDVTISPPGFPSNVIEFLSQFWAPSSLPQSGAPKYPIVSSKAYTPVAFLKYPQFSSVYTYDLATRNLLQNQDFGGEDDMVKILYNPGDQLAFSIYSPESLQPYDGNGFWWWLGADNTTSVLGVIRVARKPPLAQSMTFPSPRHRAYMVVGRSNLSSSSDDVRRSLDSLDLKFSSLDPDVFNWREYLSLNTDLEPYVPPGDPDGQMWLESHWLNNGLNEGRAASYRFSSVRYLQLNSDLTNAFGPNNYQAAINHFIQYGRKEGRSTVPRAEGGGQHTIVRSPRQDIVTVRAAGQNVNGQLGNGNTTGSSSPVQLPVFPGQPYNKVTDVAAGEYTSLAVLANGTVWMWGSNQYGARGNGSVGSQYNSPTQVPGLPAIVVPSAKDRHVVAAGLSAYAVVDNTGKVWTWGAGWSGQLGNGSTNARYTPGKVQKSTGGDLTGIVSISIGQSQMVALDIDGHVWTWGWNQYGALGSNTTGDTSTAVRVVISDGSILSGITQVVAGGSSFCVALHRNGLVYGWGNNGSGQLGMGSIPSTPFAQVIPIPGQFALGIAAGSYHALARTRNRTVYAWGYNGWGQLGNPQAQVNQRSPILMNSTNGMSGITEVAAGGSFSLMTRANASSSTIFAVGDNQSGQLGCYGLLNGCTNNATQTSPVQTGF